MHMNCLLDIIRAIDETGDTKCNGCNRPISEKDKTQVKNIYDFGLYS